MRRVVDIARPVSRLPTSTTAPTAHMNGIPPPEGQGVSELGRSSVTHFWTPKSKVGPSVGGFNPDTGDSTSREASDLSRKCYRHLSRKPHGQHRTCRCDTCCH